VAAGPLKVTTVVAHWLLLCAGVMGIAHAQPEIKWKTVGGPKLRSIFVDHELADGVHYAYRFRPDGTFTGYEMARDVRGQWRAADGELCWTWTRPRAARNASSSNAVGPRFAFCATAMNFFPER